MAEKPKRLAPTSQTLRELYLKSGNRCAFPSCPQMLFNSDGVFVGQVCHIEAAEPGGERFNKNQNNEERRHVSNLVLMCYNHHVQTDDVSKFPVEKMKRIKEQHEAKFSDVVEKMLLKVSDNTDLNEPIYPENLTKINKILKWQNSKELLAESLDELNKMIGRLAKIPEPSREFFNIIIKRGDEGKWGNDLEISMSEIRQVTNLSSNDLRECLSILGKYGFTHDGGEDDLGGELLGVSQLKSGWGIWSDLKSFCQKEGIDISTLIVSLDFSVISE